MYPTTEILSTLLMKYRNKYTQRRNKLCFFFGTLHTTPNMSGSVSFPLLFYKRYSVSVNFLRPCPRPHTNLWGSAQSCFMHVLSRRVWAPSGNTFTTGGEKWGSAAAACQLHGVWRAIGCGGMLHVRGSVAQSRASESEVRGGHSLPLSFTAWMARSQSWANHGPVMSSYHVMHSMRAQG